MKMYNYKIKLTILFCIAIGSYSYTTDIDFGHSTLNWEKYTLEKQDFKDVVGNSLESWASLKNLGF